MRRISLIAVSAVAVLGLGATGFLLTRESEVDAFRKSPHHAEFCRDAAPLDLQRSEQLTPHKRQHVIEDLAGQAPDGISKGFDRLIDWYEHPRPEHEQAARESGVKVGEFIERVCDDIDIGGIRA
ncbi:hypothetical protein ACFYZJ_14185 [Streptomyces sp. NPDC001848]|uniref:hypothetical protein n=1 Tax=Streptomyces sp. NPDC001848 TaxID=3364618 RepID=UPI0036B1B70E